MIFFGGEEVCFGVFMQNGSKMRFFKCSEKIGTQNVTDFLHKVTVAFL